ncbi:MAG: insulinase family protein [Dialister micraerophilus]|uniref:insulinase family protein n=1 Tax=Dialister micraerophilus TaxID=309120 RepID=UPI002550265D|nr:insulinase family protein [Dialister micraerophilus]MDK8253736.1 insulinase family protein [Dialister micraerophilus]MDK8285156.1 insulinase family protein [Dialister micraerophilus]
MKFNKGDVIGGFKIKQNQFIQEVNSDVYLMVHEKSGAKLLYLDTTDDNKVFSIGFRTPPDNSKGTPHILEHSTLCGSRKFPLKEPFVELVKGSLNTFLNAMTWPDKTMYPVASRNAVDFHNLMDVYLDAVFYPNCIDDPQILMQEGWHYELEDKDSELTYNGVVYNEMKGALSSGDAIMENFAMEKLFPNTTYGVESGGDPEVIPALSYKEFVEFYKKFYHPSNSYIFLYGDMDIEKTLNFIDSEYLSNFNEKKIDSQIKTQVPFKKREVINRKYGISESESTDKKAIHALYTAFNDHMSTLDSLAFEVLNYVLIEIEGAPLKKAVLDAELGSELSGSYTDGYKQPVWTIQLSGTDVNNQKKFEETIDETLRALALNGIDKSMLKAAINRIEFTLRENDYRGRPKGLFYGIRAMELWLYDRNPMDALKYFDNLKQLKKFIDTNYFENLILKYVIKNNHQVLITMEPEKGLTEKKNALTAQKLEAFKNSLSEEQLNEIVENTKKLKVRQASKDSEDALKTIPLLERKDLKRIITEKKIKKDFVNGVDYLHYDVNTSGISYVRLFFNLFGINENDIFYANLLTSLLGSMDTQKYTYGELTRLENSNTGGINFSVMCFGDYNNSDKYVPTFEVGGKALTANNKCMMELLKEIICHTEYTERKRLKELILSEKTKWDMTVFDRGHLLTMNRLISYFSKTGEFTEKLALSYYYFLADLVNNYDKNYDEIVKKLESVSAKIFTRNNLTIEVIGNEKDSQSVKDLFKSLICDMEIGEKNNKNSFEFNNDCYNEGFLTSGKVNYVSKGGNFKKHGFKYTGAVRVMETILRYDYLWKKVRVLGGAYGAFVQFSPNGNAVLCSYRDPNLKETLDVFKGIPDYLRNLKISEREMTKYVIGTMAAEEVQFTPSMLGDRAAADYFKGSTAEDRERIRNEIINCTLEDIHKLADLVESVINEPYLCVMGSEHKVKKSEEIFKKIRSLPN